MVTLTSLPTEIRLKIWRYAVPEEVEIRIDNSRSSKLSTTTPQDPFISLLLTCLKVRDEVLEMDRPLLALKSTEQWYTKFEEYMRLAELCVKRSTSIIRFVMRCIMSPGQRTLIGEPVGFYRDSALCTILGRHFREAKVGSKISILRPVDAPGPFYDYEMICEVVGSLGRAGTQLKW